MDNYFPHIADIGIVGRGATIEQAFISAAKSMFAIMTDLDRVLPKQTVPIQFDESDVELALVTWLNQLLTQAREHNMVFSQFVLQHDGVHWVGTASGETWQTSFCRGTEVKGATLTQLSVKQTDHQFEVRCVVDV